MAITVRDVQIELRDRYLSVKWFVQDDWWRTWFGKWLCERGGHKPGVWWFNPGGTKPDMRCKRCDTDLG